MHAGYERGKEILAIDVSKTILYVSRTILYSNVLRIFGRELGI